MDGVPTRAGLFAALIELCNRFRAAGDIDCFVTLAEAHMQVGPQLADVIYRGVRELLMNVRMHAQASRVQVSSSLQRDGSVVIVVADNGIGLPMHWRRANPFTADSGIGLWSIDQRMRACGARLEIESSARGTRAMLVIPADLLSPS
jgi:two-component system NarL family sensor kinase